MKEILQTKFDLEGNCLGACIACLFDIGIEDIPYFLDNKTWTFDLSKWFYKMFDKYLIVIDFLRS